MKRVHLLLDYDGYICKSWYAAANCEGDQIDEAERIILELTKTAQDKAVAKYGLYDTIYITHKIVSGHTWKRDLYPTYKLTRKRDEALGNFREYVLIKYADELIRVPQLEADDVLVAYQQYLLYNAVDDSIVFSDDKDLNFYTIVHSKLNASEPIVEELDESNLYRQMLAGDSEDNIQGIPKVGMKTADKLLNLEYSLKKVISIYKEKGISMDECAKNLNLVIPLSVSFIKDGANLNQKFIEALESGNKERLDSATMNMILGQCRYVSDKVIEGYKNEN